MRAARSQAARAAHWSLPLPPMSADDVVRFWSRVRRGGGESSCWIWTGKLRRGYGRFRVGEYVYTAHRVAWELLNGPLPKGYVLDHGEVCSNSACVNPSHLEAVTHGENVRRANAKRPAPATSGRRRRV